MSFDTLVDAITESNYPFVRRDGQVRAKILSESVDSLLIEITYDKIEPTKRRVTREYWENNFWEGLT